MIGSTDSSTGSGGHTPPAWESDPVAQKIEWAPASPGGTSFRSHRLEPGGVTRLEFRATGLLRLFRLVFLGLGALTLVPGLALAAFMALRQDGFSTELGFTALLTLVVGTSFITVSLVLSRTLMRPRVFDKASGRFWTGTPPSPGDEAGRHETWVQLSDIHAIQLVSERVASHSTRRGPHRGPRSYRSTELNLVLQDGQRITVVDHGDAGAIRRDARVVADFLRVPLWDAID